MRKTLIYLVGILSLAWANPVLAQGNKPNPFDDVPKDHWAYEAVTGLQARGILKGYPDGHFRGKRTLTRYEFAVALQRMLEQMNVIPGPGNKGPQGEPGPAGPQGPVGPPGIRPAELDTIRRLLGEFQGDLRSLGDNVVSINRRLDRLEKDMADVKADLAKRPLIGGGVFFGIRADRANGGYIDYDGHLFGVGFPKTSGSGLVNTPVVIHQFNLDIASRIPGGATVDTRLVTGNYKEFLGGNFAQITPFLNTNPGSDTYIDKLVLSAPFGAVGRSGHVDIGRIPIAISHLTLMKPDVDRPFYNPFVDDGMYRMDGVTLNTRFGSLGVMAFGGQTKSVTGSADPFSTGLPFNSPLVGISNGPFGTTIFGKDAVGAATPGWKPVGQPKQGQMTVDQLAGITLTLPIQQLQGGFIRFTGIDTSAKDPFHNGLGFNNVLIPGVDGNLKITNRVALDAEWAKTITGTSRFHTVNPYENNAFNATVGYGSGPLAVRAGYKYIDPLFYAPGYWGHIGNWINPTNIQGPTFRASYDATPNLGVMIGGDFFTAARNRAAVGGISQDDDISRILVGLKWDLSKNVNTTVDWEGVYWSLSGVHSGIPGIVGTVHPTEHYVNFGAGLNLTGNTVLKLGYQIGDFNGHGALNAGGIGSRYNFNTVTGTVAVKF